MPGSHSVRWLVFFVCGALGALGCSTDSPQAGSSGSLSLDLTIADGVVINTVSWEITNGDMEPMSGDINTAAPGSTASVEVFGIPPGQGYRVELAATSEDGETTCRGSAEFDVEVGVSTDVMVILNCKLPPRFGAVRVNGKFNICAELVKVVVSPLQTSVGNDIDLLSIATDAEGDPITTVWTDNGGSFADPSAPSTTYTCEEIGEHEITVSVTDNDKYCDMATWTVPITCVAGPGGDLCEDVDCDDGNECTDNDCDPASGECINDPANEGGSCDEGGMCESGECVPADLCDGVDCDDGNECTADLCDPADGSCSNTAVDDGTDCDSGAGMCVDGNCMPKDLCDGVVCDDTGNECTVAMCNTETGVCDVMNAPDGTECNDGAGACSAGVCVDNDLCNGVDCSSANQCVMDGTCDPANGQCIPGGNQPADTDCTDGGVCDGQGNCVACNDPSQCNGGDACNAPTCVDNACGTAPVMDGTDCDFMGAPGVCNAGTCIAAPECVTDGDCDDGNACTINSCIDGACISNPDDGASCDAAGDPGLCNGGACIGLCDGVDCTSTSQCVGDGTCNVQNGQCDPGSPLPEGTACTENGGSTCDGAGNCVAAAMDCGTTSGTVQLGCTNGVTSAQSPFPNEMTVTVNEPVMGGASFTADVSGIGAFPKFFLDAAQSTVPGGVRSAIVEGFNATAEARNGTGQILLQADPAGITPGLTSFCQYPKSTVCTADSDCIVPPCNAPVLVADVPLSTDCGAGGFCEGIGQGSSDGPTAECNITSPPSFCVTGDLLVPLVAPGGPQAVTAGASGEVVFNWAVDPATITCPDPTTQAPKCTSTGGTVPDGAYILPPSIYGDPVGNPASVGLNGIRLNVQGALFVALQCSGGQDGGACSTTTTTGCLVDADCPGGETCVGVGVDDDIIMPTDLATVPTRCPIN